MSKESISVAERLQFGLIAAAFGAVVGILSSLLFGGLAMVFLGHQHLFNGWLIGFSPAFFLGVGVARGSKAADTVIDSFVTVFMLALNAVAMSSTGNVITAGADSERWRWRAGHWWIIVYLAGLVVAAWLG